MIKALLAVVFCFVGVLLNAEQPTYFYLVSSDIGECVSYFYPSGGLPDGSLLSGFDYDSVLGWYTPDWSSSAAPIDLGFYQDCLDCGTPYVPFSSDPVYLSFIPSGSPSSTGGGGSSPGSGSGGGGFADASAFSSLGDFVSGLGLAVGGLALAGVGAVSSFLVYRKVVASAKSI